MPLVCVQCHNETGQTTNGLCGKCYRFSEKPSLEQRSTRRRKRQNDEDTAACIAALTSVVISGSM